MKSLNLIWNDFRYAIRGLARNPHVLFIAVLSLGLGIGVNTTIFGIINNIFLSELTVADPERLLYIKLGNSDQVSYPNYRDIQGLSSFSGIAGYTNTEVIWKRGEQRERIPGQVVTDNYFDLLGIKAARGRTFTSQEARSDSASQLVVLSHGFWQRHLNGDPSVIGQALDLNGHPYVILGILPPDLRLTADYGASAGLFLSINPILSGHLNDRSQVAVELIGRLAPGVTRQQALAELTVVAQRLERIYPEQNRGFGEIRRLYGVTSLERLRQVGADPVLALFASLLVIVSFVLLIACANVASLLLARASNRKREIAVRLAIGAGRRQLVQQLLVESFVLVLLGAALGGLLSFWLIRLMGQISLPIPILAEMRLNLDLKLIVYALIVIALTTTLCGLAPALQSTRGDVARALKGEETQYAHRRLTMRNLLVMGQVTISVILLVIAFHFVRTLLVIKDADPGFDVAHTASVRVNLPPGKYEGSRLKFFYEQAMERLQNIPGVEAASCAAIVPLSFSSAGIGNLRIEGDPNQTIFGANENAVGPRYFETMRIPMLQGREFNPSDREGTTRVVVINETFARRYFNERNAVGGRIIHDRGKEREVLEIIGVVRDSKYMMMGEAPAPALYRAYLQPNEVRSHATLLFRTTGPPTAVFTAAQRAISELDGQAFVETRLLRDYVTFANLPGRLGAILLIGLGLLGVALAVVGIYGTVAYNVSRRTSEFGIRMALGATPEAILRMILRDGLAIILIGGLIGVVISFVLMQPLKMFLAATVSVDDPLNYAVVVVFLSLVGLGAILAPARRAMRLDPVTALRHE